MLNKHQNIVENLFAMESWNVCSKRWYFSLVSFQLILINNVNLHKTCQHLHRATSYFNPFNVVCRICAGLIDTLEFWAT